ncbi:MAG TPA: twin-arginine translocation signal domain-containing protein [Rhodanobacteraceae bacterium]|nr:twin-arginine translocation signal domain-containing protein [Rhodanobacteraceae bacterium]
MDGTRFDNWARARAKRLTRRQAVGGAGAAGVAAALGSVLATEAQPAGPTCQMTIQALTSAGPSAGVAYGGVLEIAVGQDGAIDEGSLAFDGGPTVPVAGRADGRALSLRATFPNGDALVLTGTGEDDIDRCTGALSGVFGGPELGDTGSWQIDPAASQLTTPAGASTSGTASTATPTPTATPCPGSACDAPFVLDASTCECICPDTMTACGSTCCAAGMECSNDAPGTCFCPTGTEQCGDGCVPECASGTYLDPTSCTCGPCNLICEDEACTSLELDTCECVTICSPSAPYCCNGLCYDTEPVMCNGLCVPAEQTQSDPNNCGPNCEACPTGMLCSAGQCICISGAAYCAGTGCVDTMTDTQNCGSCGNVCPADNPICYMGQCAHAA